MYFCGFLFAYRFLGFSPLLISTCNATNSTPGDIRIIYYNETLDLDAFLNPIALLLCYYTLVIASSLILDTKVKWVFFMNSPHPYTQNRMNDSEISFILIINQFTKWNLVCPRTITKIQLHSLTLIADIFYRSRTFTTAFDTNIFFSLFPVFIRSLFPWWK